MALWSTGPPGDPTSIAHLMTGDPYGRPSEPLCGVPSRGMRHRLAEWDDVPVRQRCAACARGLAEQLPGAPGQDGPPTTPCS